MTLITKTPSALNVDIPGTAGSFAVSRKGEASGAIEVQYILTHVALGNGSQKQLLDMLAPVREVFDLDQLDFDEIMQRDIDDSRVSLDLIPYLLDHRNTDLVKLFPPIVVVVLPLQELSPKPDSKYLAVQKAHEPVENAEGYKWELVTAGPIGREQFQFKQLRRPDGTIDPAHSVLRLAQGNCALAIVDGQHRAMALLALYRNLTAAWSDARRAAYQQYYRVWSPDEIRNFDLQELQMPMIVCTFPQLDATYVGEMDVIKAARRVFLDLNKNAKKVSDSRNKLLDDQDMVSQCLRAVLANVKKYDVNSTSPLRIWNIELDQAQDRSVISSPVALTGVSHLYYVAEHLLFYTSRVKDIGSRKGRLARSRRLEEAYTRLGLLNDLTSEERGDNTRTNYSASVAAAVEKRWCAKYGDALEQVLSDFHPFSAHCFASFSVHERLKSVNNIKLKGLIFDGQAGSRTFEEFKERLELKMAADADWKTPELLTIKKDVDAQIAEYQLEIAKFKAERAAAFLKPVKGPHMKTLMPSPDAAAAKGREILDELYQQIFTSIAFQAAVFLTLVETYEAIYDSAAGDGHTLTRDDVSEYLESLHHLFKPASFEAFVSLVGVFRGDLSSQDGTLRLAPTKWTFGNFVVSGEMQPDEWPKYRYLILEVWTSKNSAVQKLIDEDVKECRASVMRHAYKRALTNYCTEKGVLEQNVRTSDREAVLLQVRESYECLLANVKRKKVNLSDTAAAVRAQLVVLSTDEEEEGTFGAP